MPFAHTTASSKDGPFRWIRQEFFENEYIRYTEPPGRARILEYFMAAD